MVHRRFGLLKYVTPFVAAASLVLGFGARAAETSAAKSAQYASDDIDGMSWCQVSGETVNIRVGPNVSNQAVTTLRSGDYIRAKASQANWLEMEWPRNVPAWVLKDTITVGAADTKVGTVRTIRARIMGLGANNAPEVAVLERGARVVIVGETGDWYQVQAPAAAKAYISAKYVVVGVHPPADTIALPPASKLTARAHHDDAAESIELPTSKKIQKEIDGDAGEVVVVQSQAQWPTARALTQKESAPRGKIDTANKTGVTLAVAVPNKFSEDNSASAAVVELPASHNKNGIDAQLAQAAESRKKAEAAEIVRTAAAERKHLDDVEFARKSAEARRSEIEAQVQTAAERKHALETEIAKLAEARKKAEADEVARQATEKKRLEEVETVRVATDERRKADLLEQSRLASERKRLEDEDKERSVVETRKKVEIETQTKAVSEKKKALEEELARLNESKKKAEAEESARIAVEKKRLGEAETARIAAEAKRAELEEQAQRAAEKKKVLEAEIVQLAAAKKKEEQEATARAARERKNIEDAEIARKEADARRKAEQDEFAKKETERKRLQAADAERAAADMKRRGELEEQERAALARKKALEVEITRLYAEKRKYEEDALARVANDKKNTEEAQVAHSAAEKKRSELEELTRLAAEKKRAADEETARAASERKRADEAQAARLIAEKKHAEEVEAAHAASERKLAEEAATRVATERKRSEEVAAQKAAELKRAEENAAIAAAERRKSEEAEIARLANEKKRVELETAVLAAETQRKAELEKERQESARKSAELASAQAAAEKVAASKAARLPEPGSDEIVKAAAKIALITDRPIVLSETDLIAGRDEPSEQNYNVDYVPQQIRDVRKKYVVPQESPRRAQVVAETIDVDAAPPAAKISAPLMKESAQSQNHVEPYELAPQKVQNKVEPRVVYESHGPAVVHVTDSNFDSEIEKYHGAVLVDFSATWCGPCQRIAPMVDELAEQFRGRIKVVKIDVDQAPATAHRFGVSGIPCLMIFKDGKSVDTHVGAPARETLERWMRESSDAPGKAVSQPSKPTEVPAQTADSPAKADVAPAKAKDLGMRIIPPGQRSILSDVGQLERVSNSEISGVKYLIRSNGYVTRYIIEPADVDMSPMVGRTISISGYGVGRSYSDVSVIQMKNASTFG